MASPTKPQSLGQGQTDIGVYAEYKMRRLDENSMTSDKENFRADFAVEWWTNDLSDEFVFVDESSRFTKNPMTYL
jgi:hypothetical protein